MNRRGFILTTAAALCALPLLAKEKPPAEAEEPKNGSPDLLIKDGKTYWFVRSRTGWKKGEVVRIGGLSGIAHSNLGKNKWGYVLMDPVEFL